MKRLYRNLVQFLSSPIGIDIYTETSEEIAVGIVTLIKVRAERETCAVQR